MMNPDRLGPREFRDRTRAGGELRARAGELRREATTPEVVLWSRLRRSQLAGFRFRRQHPIGPFIADFFCHQARLVVEVDSRFHEGLKHDDDRARDAWMNDAGVDVLRVTAGQIATDLDAVLATILRRLRERNREY